MVSFTVGKKNRNYTKRENATFYSGTKAIVPSQLKKKAILLAHCKIQIQNCYTDFIPL